MTDTPETGPTPETAYRFSRDYDLIGRIAGDLLGGRVPVDKMGPEKVGLDRWPFKVACAARDLAQALDYVVLNVKGDRAGERSQSPQADDGGSF